MEFLLKIKYSVLLLVLSLCWGNSFFLIKIALQSFSPIQIVFLRTLIGGLFLFILLLIKKIELRIWLKNYKRFWIMSLLSIALPWTSLSYAEKITSSSLAGIVNGTIPLFTMALAHFLLEHDRFSKKKLVGLILGSSGMTAIFLPPLIKGIYFEMGGLLLLFFNSFCSSCSIVYARKYLWNIPSIIAPVFQLFFAGLSLLPFFIVSLSSETLSSPSVSSIASLVTLGIVGTGVAFLIFFYLVKHAGASFTSTNSFLIPLVAIFSGVVFLDETISISSLVGAGFIFSSLLLTHSLVSFKDISRLFTKK